MNWKTRLGDTTAKYTMHKELDTQILIRYFFDEKNQLYLDIVIVLPWLKPLWRTTVRAFSRFLSPCLKIISMSEEMLMRLLLLESLSSVSMVQILLILKLWWRRQWTCIGVGSSGFVSEQLCYICLLMHLWWTIRLRGWVMKKVNFFFPTETE